MRAFLILSALMLMVGAGADPGKDAGALLQQAIVAARKGDLSESIRLATEAVNTSPKLSRARLVRGEL